MVLYFNQILLYCVFGGIFACLTKKLDVDFVKE